MSKHVSGFVFSSCGRSCKDPVVRGTNQVLYTGVVSVCLSSLWPQDAISNSFHWTGRVREEEAVPFFFCRGSSSAEYAAHKALLGVADEICAYLHAYQCIHVCAYVAMVKKKKKGLKQERLDLPLSTCFKAPSSPYYSAVLRGSVWKSAAGCWRNLCSALQRVEIPSGYGDFMFETAWQLLVWADPLKLEYETNYARTYTP